MKFHAIIFADIRIDSATPPALRKLYNVSMIERHIRNFASMEIESVTVVGPDGDDRITRHVARIGSSCHVTCRTNINEADAACAYIVVEGHHVYDQRAMNAMLQAEPDTMLVDVSGVPGHRANGDCRLAVVGAETLRQLAPKGTHSEVFWDALTMRRRRGACRRINIRDIDPYMVSLRRSLPAFWLPVATEEDERTGEAYLIDAAQKGTLDFPAQYLHPPLENWMTRQIAKTRLTPNHITSVTNLIAFVATGLLAAGALIPGLLIAMLIGVLDGVDGKLARVTVRCTRFGDRFEHIFDNIYELSWYWALGWALDDFMLSGAITLFYLLDRAATGVFKHWKGIELFDYAPVDQFFRRIGGRRNIYILMLFAGALLHASLTAFQAVAVWSIVTAVFHWGRALWLLLLSKKERQAAVYTTEAAS